MLRVGHEGNDLRSLQQSIASQSSEVSRMIAWEPAIPPATSSPELPTGNGRFPIDPPGLSGITPDHKTLLSVNDSARCLSKTNDFVA